MKQEKSPLQELSWVDTNDVKGLYEKLKDVGNLLYKKRICQLKTYNKFKTILLSHY